MAKNPKKPKSKLKPKRQSQSTSYLRRALISVSDKTGVVEFARGLANLGFEIVSTGGTAKTLREAGLLVTPVDKVTRFPEMLDGRVKTLHPRVFAGILAQRKPEHEEQIKAKRIRRFDLVCINLYPFEKTVANPQASHEDIVEQIDIGGPSLLRAAAKNADNGVCVVCDPNDYDALIGQLLANGRISSSTRRYLAAKALKRTALYDTVISAYLAKQVGNPELAWLALEHCRSLRKAESNDRGPADLFRDLNGGYDDPLAWDKWTFIGDPGYVNVAGGDNALAVMCRLAEAFRRNFKGKVPYIAIACKHGNPCGLGVDWKSPSKALERAMFGDPTAAMGSEVMTNFYITGQEAATIHVVPKSVWAKVGRQYWGPDVIFAPGFGEIAESLLTTRKPERHLVANAALANPTMPPYEYSYRQVRGGWLRQKAPTFVLNLSDVQELIGKKRLSRDDKATLLIAWVVAWEGVSNSAVLAKALQLIGTGLGQQDRRCAFILMLLRAKMAWHDPQGAFWASDGFVPYAKRKQPDDPPEPLELMQEVGCLGGVLPADGQNWPQIREFLEESGQIGVALDAAHRGFCKH